MPAGQTISRPSPYLLRAMLAVSGLTGLGACTAIDPCAGLVGGMPMTETTLYFGLHDPGGVPIADEAWEAFRTREIATRFPQGFTLVEASGHWRNRETGQDGREPSRVLVRLHDGADNNAIDTLIETYKDQFSQQSVLRTDAPVCVRF